jgi:hypothetical protein
LTRPSVTWTRWVRTATRTARSSCSCCVTTSRCGPARCRTRRRPSHQRHKHAPGLLEAQRRSVLAGAGSRNYMHLPACRICSSTGAMLAAAFAAAASMCRSSNGSSSCWNGVGCSC